MIRYQKTVVDFDLMKWVVKAIYNQKEKFYIENHGIQNVLIEDGHAICSDGRRLHYATLDNPPENGLYEVVKNSRDEIILNKKEGETKFIDYKKFFKHSTCEPALEIEYCESPIIPFCKLIKLLPEENGMEYNYFSDVVGWNKISVYLPDEVNGCVSGKFKPVFFYGEKQAAIIMPLKLT